MHCIGNLTVRMNFEVKPEYGSYMLELTPTFPYNQYACSLNGIESNMKNRRVSVSEYLKPNEHLLMIPHFPLLGEGDFAAVMGPLHGADADSDYVPDTIISPFTRFSYFVFCLFHLVLLPAISENVVDPRSTSRSPRLWTRTRRFLPRSTWMPWASAWGAAVSKSHSKPRTSRKAAFSTTS